MRIIAFAMRLIALAALCLIPATPTPAQPTLSYEGRPAILLANDKLELTVLPKGGAFVRLILKEDTQKISPIWDPLRYARETGQDGFGDSVGHFLCVDGFGPTSAEEKAAGLDGHGEAHRLPWKTRFYDKKGNTLALTQAVTLPILQENYERTIRLVDGEHVVQVQSQLENLLAFDRPVNWAEHATIGAPFLEPGVTVVDMPARQASTRPYVEGWKVNHRLASGKAFKWPLAPGRQGGKVDMRLTPSKMGSGDHTTTLLDPANKLVWVTAFNPAKRLMLGYVFRPEEFPWLQTWEHYPEDGRSARGLEFSTQPYDVPRREAVSTGTMFGAPAYRWLPAKSKIEARYLMFYTRTPEGMRHVDEIRLENGALVIADKKAKQQIRLSASLGL